MKDISKKYLLLLIAFLCVFRLLYGLASEFWFDDELQIYLIGLKSFTTETWPYYGPDVVYTQTQIPGALQGILVSLPLYILPIPEAPSLFLGLLSIIILGYLAHYISKRFSDIPKWAIWILTFTTPWMMHFSTRVVNPSYVLIFSIPFFLCFIEAMDYYKNALIKKGLAFFVIGFSICCIMQIHLSWVLLFPFAVLAFLYTLKNDRKKFLQYLLYFLLGAAIGISTLIPTLVHPDSSGAGKVASNIVFKADNILNAPAILTKYLSFAAFEINYMMGANTKERLEIVYHHWWMAPFTAYLYILGFAQVALFVITFFIKNDDDSWKKIKWTLLGSYLLLFISFFFSIKSPSSHAFIILFPIPFIYSFYCYRWLFSKHKIWSKFFAIALFSGIIFHIAMGLESYHTKSLYLNREKAQQAIEQKDYKILGIRRADKLGYGY